MFGHVLGGIDGTMLASCTSEAYHEVTESSFHVPLHGSVYQSVGMFQERENLTIIFQEFDDGGIQTCERFVAFVLAWIVHGSTIEYISATVSGWVVWNPFLVGETHDLDGELALFQIVLELLEFRQLAEYGAEVRIFRIVFFE